MAEIIQLRDYHLKRLQRDAGTILNDLIEFAKSGGPVVEGSQPCVDRWAGKHCPEGIEGLLYETSMGWTTPYDAG